MAAAIGLLNLQEIPTCGSRSVDCFQRLEQIGEGTYAQVYKAKEIQTGEIVALKKIRMENEKEGFPITAIREIKILQKLHHNNVVKLKEIVSSPEKDEQGKPGAIFMVFEYMDHDLAGLTRCAVKFTVPQIKCYMRQLLTGLHYCHLNQVLHRDIKGANLLLDNEGTLKLADFGLARFFANGINASLTNRVITLWYRPPELLLGETKYGPAVDMWSVGCIFAELLDGKPLFPGKDESEQISKIFEICGAPDESNWPGVTKLPWYTNYKPNRPFKKRLREHFRLLDRDALELLEKMLVLDPAQRISTSDALVDEYFWNDPLPCDPKSLPKYESSHEFQTKQKRQQQRHNEEAGKHLKLQHPLAYKRVVPIKQNGQAQAQRQTRPNLKQRQYEEATEYQKVQPPPALTFPLPFQQSGEAHTQSQTGPNQQKKQHEEAPECQKPQHPSPHTRPFPFQQSGQVHAQSHTGVNQQQRQQEEAAKHQKLQQTPAYTRSMPNQQSGQYHAQRQAGPNQPMHSGPGHHHGYPRGPSRYSQSGTSSGKRYHQNHGRGYEQHWQGSAYGSSSMRAMGPQGGGSSISEGAQHHQQGGFHSGYSAARESSTMMGQQGGGSSISEGERHHQLGGFHSGYNIARVSSTMSKKYDQHYGSR